MSATATSAAAHADDGALDALGGIVWGLVAGSVALFLLLVVGPMFHDDSWRYDRVNDRVERAEKETSRLRQKIWDLESENRSRKSEIWSLESQNRSRKSEIQSLERQVASLERRLTQQASR